MNLFEYDQACREEGITLLCGVDEAGRGPLAGPVVAAAVIFSPETEISGLNDSKKLSDKKRELLFDEIQQKAVSWGIGIADHAEIDQHNILQATFLAMKRAVKQLSVSPERILVDGNRDPKFQIATQTVVKGDATSASIAAASILAKVTRDRMMLEMDSQYPQYHFAKHKGYPTKDHYEQIAAHGICPIHRKSFLKKILSQENQERK